MVNSYVQEGIDNDIAYLQMQPTNRFSYRDGISVGSSTVPFALFFTFISKGSCPEQRFQKLI